MSKKNKHHHRPTTVPAAHLPASAAAGQGAGVAATAAGGPSRSEEDLIRDMLAQGKIKPALERAKDFHKRVASAASEGVLVEAYLARLRSLLESGLREEARSMADLILARYGAARERKVEIELIFATHGSLGELVAPLADPDLPAPARAAIEETLRRTLADPGALARCPALAEDHPLRRGAAALAAALELVTTRAVQDEELALPEIARRSPLAPWKLLLRALAAFYRGEDEACRRALEAIPPDAAPARLAPALRAMLAPEAAPPAELAPPLRALVRRVSGSQQELREALERLDHEYQEMHPSRVLRAIREAIAAARASAPELLETLRQHIAIRTLLEGAPPEEIREAMGGPSLKNAAFWRLFARGDEVVEEHQKYILIICTYWEQFRRHAVAEGWFNPQGPEAVALYLHMAGVLSLLDPEHLAPARKRFIATSSSHGWLNRYYDDQPPALRQLGRWEEKPDTYFLDADQLYQRACALDPSAGNFRLWLAWARRISGEDWKDPERVAQAWAAAQPADPAPLLELSAMAERRGALDKALRWLEAAIALDPLSPAVRRAKLRLLAAAALRHLKQRKPHLVEKDLAQIETLPQAAEGDRPAFLDGARWLAGALAGDAPETQEARRAELIRRLGSEAAAEVFLSGLAEASGLKGVRKLGPPPGTDLTRKIRAGMAKIAGSGERAPELPEGESLPQAVGRALALGDDLNITLPFPTAWAHALSKALERPELAVEPARLRTLAEAALRDGRFSLASEASGVGLQLGGPATARFLLLRARTISLWETVRRSDLFLAAITLARRQRDSELVREAIDFLREGDSRGRFLFYDEIDERIAGRSQTDMDPAHLERVLASELGKLKRQGAEMNSYFADCPCQECRIARGEVKPPAPPRRVDEAAYPGGAPVPDAERDEDWDEEGEATAYGDLEASIKELARQAGSGKASALLELLADLEKHVRPDGSVPSPDEIIHKDPALARRIGELLGHALGEDDDEELPFDEFAPPRQNTKTQRKRRSKKHKK